MARRHFIVVGDTTTAGGKVLTGAPFFSIQSLAGDQRPQAFVGDQVECGQCGPTTIISGVSHMTFDGREAAVEGCSLACGHKLVSTEQRLSWIEESISDGALRAGSTRANFDRANNKEPTPSTREVTRIFWTYGDDETLLPETSRLYADLNLHIEVKDYLPGEVVEVLIEGCDGEDLAEGVPNLTLSATVQPGGIAKLKNVFEGRRVELYARK